MFLKIISLLFLLSEIIVVNGLLLRWKNNWDIHYVKEGNNPRSILLVPGFGVGVFHYEKNIKELSKDFTVYSLDLFGQGKSWPSSEITEEQQLVFSSKLWSEQIKFFIDNVIKEPTHIVGNSLGGYLSVIVGVEDKSLIRSVTLLNPAPFWGFNDDSSPLWDGTLPAPDLALLFGKTYFNLIKSRTIVKTMLSGVYANKAVDNQLVDDIIDAAGNKFGPLAFTSILFANKDKREFDDLLSSLDVPTQLIMGQNDPWIVPLWGQRFKRIKRDILYWNLTPSGHCPQHETPRTVNYLLKTWIDNIEDGKSAFDIDNGFELKQIEDHGVEVSARVLDGSPNPNNIFEIISEFLHKRQLEKQH